MASPIVQLRQVSKTYGHGATMVQALFPLDLDIYGGTVAGLRGPSGSGKSTILNLIAAITTPDHGTIILDNRTIFDRKWVVSDLRQLRLEKIGFIFQFHNLIPFLTVQDNIGLVLELAGQSRSQARHRAMELLDYLQVADRAKAMPSQLSGGQAQRVAIARALANRPPIILADEPTAALDSDRASIVMDLLHQVAREQNAAVIVVTHDDKIMSRFDIIHTLRDGRLVDHNGQTQGNTPP